MVKYSLIPYDELAVSTYALCCVGHVHTHLLVTWDCSPDNVVPTTNKYDPHHLNEKFSSMASIKNEIKIWWHKCCKSSTCKIHRNSLRNIYCKSLAQLEVYLAFNAKHGIGGNFFQRQRIAYQIMQWCDTSDGATGNQFPLFRSVSHEHAFAQS